MILSQILLSPGPVPGSSSKDASCKSSHGAKDSVPSCTALASSLTGCSCCRSESLGLRLARLRRRALIVLLLRHRLLTPVLLLSLGFFTVVPCFIIVFHPLTLFPGTLLLLIVASLLCGRVPFVRIDTLECVFPVDELNLPVRKAFFFILVPDKVWFLFTLLLIWRRRLFTPVLPLSLGFFAGVLFCFRVLLPLTLFIVTLPPLSFAPSGFGREPLVVIDTVERFFSVIALKLCVSLAYIFFLVPDML